MVIKKIQVRDMECNGCASRAQTALLKLDGVVKVMTSVEEHMAEVTYDEQRLGAGDLLDALQQAGFKQAQEWQA